MPSGLADCALRLAFLETGRFLVAIRHETDGGPGPLETVAGQGHRSRDRPPMSALGGNRPAGSLRRPPPPFRRLGVLRTERLSARMHRVTLGGPELDGFGVTQPASSVRVLLPMGRDAALVLPEWTGNQFVLPGGGRPSIRTLTPRRFDPAGLELDVDVVIHGDGAASEWAAGARAGDEAAVSGPARGYTIDPEGRRFLLAGDETAIPAVSQLLESLPAGVPVQAWIEIATPDARLALPPRTGAAVSWLDRPAPGLPGDLLVEAVGGAELGLGVRIWAAGEAAAMQRIRRLLNEGRGFPREHATVRGYWKHGRAGGTEQD
jgi:NADPH-dependent ferric siderophore reductase